MSSSACPTLADLPPAPSGRTGFPWTEMGVTLAQTEGLPRVTIVTPSYNQERYIEETIRSVLLQGYPNSEYIILDGGSTDHSVDIIRRYDRWLAFWRSQPDRGQADAVGEGWARGSGTILAYLNSDDTYLPNAITRASRALALHEAAPAVCGGELLIDTDGLVISERVIRSVTWHDLIALNFVPQPSIFLRRVAYERAGGWDYSYHNSFDFELWTRITRFGDFVCIPDALAATRWHAGTKTLTQRPKIVVELRRIVETVLASPAGQALTWRERRYIRARLNYVLLGVYLEDSARFTSAVISNYFAALWHWLPLAPLVTRALFSALYYRAVLLYLRVAKHKTFDAVPIQSNTGVRWNEWHTRRNAEIRECE